MYISGPVEELNSILTVALDLRAKAIHFISPNIVFIIAKNEEDYIYVETRIVVGKSVLIPETSIHNMKVYIKAARKGSRRAKSIFFGEKIGTVLFTPQQMVVNDRKDLTIEVDFPFLPIKKDVEFKMLEIVKTSYLLDRPYLRLNKENTDFLSREMRLNKKYYEGKSRSSSDNILRIEDDQLVLYYTHDSVVNARIETTIDQFAINDDFPSHDYRYTDRALYLLRWLALTTPVDEVIFIPRSDHCILEGYMSNMLVKVRTMLKNDLVIEKM